MLQQIEFTCFLFDLSVHYLLFLVTEFHSATNFYIVIFVSLIAKAMELSGAGSDEIPEPEDVKVAREELKVLHDEKHRTEKVRSTVYKELDVAKQRTRKLEEVITIQ